MSLRDDFSDIPGVDSEGNPIPEIELPPITDGAALLALDLPEPHVIVDGLVHGASKFALGGSSKGKKTFILLDLAVSIASGSEWLGRRTTQGRVLYINFEIQPAFFARRLAKILEARELTLKEGELAIWNLRGFAADIENLMPRMIKEVVNGKYVLIIVDPMYKCLGNRDENKAGDIAEVMNQLEKLAVESGAAIAFGAHFTKGNQAAKESIDRISGSGVFARDPDTILTMTQHREKDAFVIDATVRNFPPVDPFCVRWEFPLMKVDSTLRPEDLKQGNGKKIPTDEEFVALLPPYGIGSKARECLVTNPQLKALFQAYGYAKDAHTACRDRAEARGLITVIREKHNKMLSGLPEAVADYLKADPAKGKAGRKGDGA